MPAPTPPTVTSSDRLWSDEVGLARAGEPIGSDNPDVYEFSNGRKAKDGAGPYSNNNQGPGKGTDENP